MNNTKLNNLKQLLEDRIKASLNRNKDGNITGWSTKSGVLISRNEAEELLDVLNKAILLSSNNTPVNESSNGNTTDWPW